MVNCNKVAKVIAEDARGLRIRESVWSAEPGRKRARGINGRNNRLH